MRARSLPLLVAAVLSLGAGAFELRWDREDPEVVKAHDQAVKAFGRGDYDRAISALNEEIRLNPKGAHAYVVRGIAWTKKGKAEPALADAEMAVRLEPKSAEAHFLRAHAWRMKNDADRAIADYSETIRLDPKFTIAYVGRAQIWDFKGDCTKANADRETARRIDPAGESHYPSSGKSNCQGTLR
jgi:tetratricopeptide (TPR) repeat protein